MDTRFKAHNTHLNDAKAFRRQDPDLIELSEKPLAYRFPLMDRLPVDQPGIYSITGGRQIGKTTVLKQWMAELLERGVIPKRIAYFTGELIDDHHALVRVLSDFLAEQTEGNVVYLLIDEITYVRDWDRGVKYLADAGLLREAVVILTGSDSVLLREARMRLPGRRGVADIVDFHLFPLTFHEVVLLKKIMTQSELEEARESVPSPEALKGLLSEFGSYLTHGGYLTAINDIHSHGTILKSTFTTYSDWIRGDVLKRRKNERILREVLGALIKKYGTQVTWNGLTRDLEVEHPATVADYIELLAQMDVLIVQPAIREDRLTAAPKKARKVIMSDPFIFHAVRSWLKNDDDPFLNQVGPLLSDAEWAGKLAEACAVSHYHRFYPIYYIKAEGEVDIAYVKDNRFWPLEVKWTGQVRPKDVKQAAKYPNSRICTRSAAMGEIHGILTEPLPLNLLRLGPSPIALL